MNKLSINLLFLFFYIITNSSFAQKLNQGVVFDEIANPISYVNITSQSKLSATTSDKDGKFYLDIFNADANLIFTAIGYESKTVKASEAKVVTLKKTILQLKEVIIEPIKNQKNIEIGDAKMINFRHHSSVSTLVLTKFFKFKPQYYQTKFIKEAIIYTKSRLKTATFKVRMFGVGADGSPTMDILNDYVIVTTKKGKQKNVVNLSDFKITFPTEGVFIGFEWIYSVENKIEEENYNGSNTKYNYSYQPYLILNWVDTDFTYAFQNNKWFRRERQSNNVHTKKDNMNHEPAINLVLTE